MRIVGALIAPVICAAAVLYFGYFTVWGARGLMALADTQRDLAVEREQLDAIRGDRERLQHRIELLQPGRADPDLVEEITRDQLIGTSPGQIAVPRRSH
ncbi:MAG TPA: septum formation initiator family protein [Rhizomicrobium sp.]|jgi:cell division protein FtsB|nr:septum formation initiator family protein [Rhizomicrobium sp.]